MTFEKQKKNHTEYTVPTYYCLRETINKSVQNGRTIKNRAQNRFEARGGDGRDNGGGGCDDDDNNARPNTTDGGPRTESVCRVTAARRG